ncbi:hypothetical protein DSO57_1026940 [Entomophthora muscae]|uniref:Uncharacterized protein n=1 Tax=Entomophthora muscae TaxID=34485 RepID=A0ACC2SF77_9FUNG|nr:hypothetical protein DSO57_1026940 [Entomophthora muscae]
MKSRLVLKLATESQIQKTWENTCQEWGRGVSVQEYFERETLLRSCPFTSSNLAVWVLVPEDDIDTLNLLSHLELISRPAYVKLKQLVTEKIYTILSVFTPPEQRKKGYGTLMLEKLCDIMRLDAVGAILFSDIGKFYERFNFKAFPSFSYYNFCI